MADNSQTGAIDQSSYCARHRRYLRPGARCPICWYEESSLRQKKGSIPRVQKCPACGEMSLFWYRCRSQWECLNIECKLGQSEAEY